MNIIIVGLLALGEGDKGIFTYSSTNATLFLRLLRDREVREFYIDKL